MAEGSAMAPGKCWPVARLRANSSQRCSACSRAAPRVAAGGARVRVVVRCPCYTMEGDPARVVQYRNIVNGGPASSVHVIAASSRYAKTT